KRDGAVTQKAPGREPGALVAKRRRNYFIAVETDEKVEFKLVPRAWTVAMIATAIPAAMRPYSIAVAPASSARKRNTNVSMFEFLRADVVVVRMQIFPPD